MCVVFDCDLYRFVYIHLHSTISYLFLCIYYDSFYIQWIVILYMDFIGMQTKLYYTTVPLNSDVNIYISRNPWPWYNTLWPEIDECRLTPCVGVCRCVNVVIIHNYNNLGRLCFVAVRFCLERRLKMPNRKRRVRLHLWYLQVKGKINLLKK